MNASGQQWESLGLGYCCVVRGSLPSRYSAFAEEIRKVFQHASSDQEPSKRLIALRQGRKTAADHSIDFRTIAAATNWNDAALADLFLASLNEALQDELAHQEPITQLDPLSSVPPFVWTTVPDNAGPRDSFHRSAGPKAMFRFAT
ncbi:hypothetical protein AAFF_G00159780 [Aldrovandia affinis]|uniref:Retrotransposon gag domain-containing protein n=1 Tax=Aldrovandia affinis TaxID=143900 RepID=A0AAD7RMT2_9TELE|nr:hypothetical protein AAFF_G00159780 [Aldrovandia affinis]